MDNDEKTEETPVEDVATEEENEGVEGAPTGEGGVEGSTEDKEEVAE